MLLRIVTTAGVEDNSMKGRKALSLRKVLNYNLSLDVLSQILFEYDVTQIDEFDE